MIAGIAFVILSVVAVIVVVVVGLIVAIIHNWILVLLFATVMGLSEYDKRRRRGI